MFNRIRTERVGLWERIFLCNALIYMMTYMMVTWMYAPEGTSYGFNAVLLLLLSMQISLTFRDCYPWETFLTIFNLDKEIAQSSDRRILSFINNPSFMAHNPILLALCLDGLIDFNKLKAIEGLSPEVKQFMIQTPHPSYPHRGSVLRSGVVHAYQQGKPEILSTLLNFPLSEEALSTVLRRLVSTVSEVHPKEEHALALEIILEKNEYIDREELGRELEIVLRHRGIEYPTDGIYALIESLLSVESIKEVVNRVIQDCAQNKLPYQVRFDFQLNLASSVFLERALRHMKLLAWLSAKGFHSPAAKSSISLTTSKISRSGVELDPEKTWELITFPVFKKVYLDPRVWIEKIREYQPLVKLKETWVTVNLCLLRKYKQENSEGRLPRLAKEAWAHIFEELGKMEGISSAELAAWVVLQPRARLQDTARVMGIPVETIPLKQKEIGV